MMLGIDEAGKGSVIGPLVVCGVLCDEKTINHLLSLGVRDSKKIKREKREELYDVITSVCRFKVLKIHAEELNELMERFTMNEILKRMYVELIRHFKPKVAYIDCPDLNVERFKCEIEERTGVEVIASHKADEIYPIVSIASIVAKVERDREIERLKIVYGDFGSGYASDPRTVEFLRACLRERGEFPPIVRLRWKTLRRITTHTLLDFFEL